MVAADRPRVNAAGLRGAALASAAVLWSHSRMSLEPTATRVWKRLTPAERQKAASAFFEQPPAEVVGTALGAIVKARRLRPQAARNLAPAEQARILAGVLDPGEPLAAALLVALHLGDRRPLLVAFLDAVGLPHADGLLSEEADAAPPVTEEKARAGVVALAASFPREQVLTYVNTLWLQDEERWGCLAGSPEWLGA
jgi:hypothetical protein